MSLQGIPIMMSADQSEWIQQIRDQDAAWVRVGKAVSGFLRTAYPQADAEACEVGNAIVALMTAGTERQIARLVAQPAPIFSFAGPNLTEVLMNMIEERDRIQTQIEQAERGIESMRDNNRLDGVADIFEATAVGPLRGMLANVQERITHIQAQIEAAEKQGDGLTI